MEIVNVCTHFSILFVLWKPNQHFWHLVLRILDSRFSQFISWILKIRTSAGINLMPAAVRHGAHHKYLDQVYKIFMENLEEAFTNVTGGDWPLIDDRHWYTDNAMPVQCAVPRQHSLHHALFPYFLTPMSHVPSNLNIFMIEDREPPSLYKQSSCGKLNKSWNKWFFINVPTFYSQLPNTTLVSIQKMHIMDFWPIGKTKVR